MGLLTSYLILDVILLAITVVLALYLNFKVRTRKYWAERHVPYEEPQFFVGNTKEANYTKPLPVVLDEFYNRHKEKKFFGIWLYIRPALLVFDLELIKNILVKDFSNFHDRGISINEELEPLTGSKAHFSKNLHLILAHLFNMSGQKWRNLRVKLTPAFTSGKMKMMYETMYDVSIRLRQFLDKPAINGDTIEVKEVLACFTTDVISSCVFGLEANSMENPKTEFRENGRLIFNPPILYFISSIIQFVAPWLQKYIPVNKPSQKNFKLLTQHCIFSSGSCRHK